MNNFDMPTQLDVINFHNTHDTLCVPKGMTLKQLVEDYDRLNNIINAILDFSFFEEECPLNFGFGDKLEEKAQDVFYENDYCEKECNDDYKKCWLKYFDKLKELKENK